MEVTDDGNAQALFLEPLYDVRNGFGCLVVVDGYAHYLAAGAGQCCDLLNGAGNISSVGVGHGLHHYGCIVADADITDRGGESFSADDLRHSGKYILAGSGVLDRRFQPLACSGQPSAVRKSRWAGLSSGFDCVEMTRLFLAANAGETARATPTH